MLTELERAVEEAVASRQWPELRDSVPSQFTILIYCISQFVNILVTFLIVLTLKKVGFTGTFQSIINPLILHNSQL
jgi:hypothetical protein